MHYLTRSLVPIPLKKKNMVMLSFQEVVAYRQQWHSGLNEIQLDISNLNNGLYHIRIANKLQMVDKPFVVNN